MSSDVFRISFFALSDDFCIFSYARNYFLQIFPQSSVMIMTNEPFLNLLDVTREAMPTKVMKRLSRRCQLLQVTSVPSSMAESRQRS